CSSFNSMTVLHSAPATARVLTVIAVIACRCEFESEVSDSGFLKFSRGFMKLQIKSLLYLLFL
ncbi:hypothetical protein, partial [Pseudomonas helleri]|uniref:hypothetical protein n=1 Tax=Pseudomonas helleri TaxID=1608996 RepID=UPI003F986F6A